MSRVTISKKENGGWAVYIDGQMVSDHATRDGAATAANQLIKAESTGVERTDP